MFEYSDAWKSPPVRLRLSGDAVHVWAVELDPEPERIAELEGLLSDDERTRARRFVFPHLQQRFTVARAVLRILLGGYLETEVSRLLFRYGPNGKPALSGAARSVQFNLAHSDALALIALSPNRELGVDLEKLHWTDSLEDLASRYFACPECALVRNAEKDEKSPVFFSFWTMKEAILKASGVGLGIELRAVDTCSFKGPSFHHQGRSWSLHRPPSIAAFASALAVEGERATLSYFRWSSESL